MMSAPLGADTIPAQVPEYLPAVPTTPLTGNTVGLRDGTETILPGAPVTVVALPATASSPPQGPSHQQSHSLGDDQQARQVVQPTAHRDLAIGSGGGAGLVPAMLVDVGVEDGHRVTI